MEYVWTPELQKAFDVAREEIVELVRRGVKSFRLEAWTCLVTSWSRCGICYVLWQKLCECEKVQLLCCRTGWVMVTFGSRFCSLAELRYHPIEGELLGVAWALEKTKVYTLGSDRLLILVDHKPLIGLLEQRELGDIDNPRLMHLAERLVRWSFRIEHIAGVKNFGPDTLSQAPGPVGQVGLLGFVDDKDMEWSGHFLHSNLLSWWPLFFLAWYSDILLIDPPAEFTISRLNFTISRASTNFTTRTNESSPPSTSAAACNTFSC